jgi:large subunit ribosomal protein L18
MSDSKNLDPRQRRHRRIRKKISGTPERPRLVVFRSARHIYAQVIDDSANQVLVSSSDLLAKAEEKVEGKKSERAKEVGLRVARRCLEKGIKQVVFDRAGYLYHGRVSKLADGAREGGLEF